MRAITILILLVGSVSTQAQENLIVNGNFEEYTACPDNMQQIDRCANWSQPTQGTPDYFNSCSTQPAVTIPSSMGTCAAYSGNAYAGIYFYQHVDGEVIYVEYIQGQTTIPLEQGKVYKLSMNVSLASVSSVAVDEFGAYFSATPFYESTPFQLNLEPQCVFHNPDFYTTFCGWMHVETTFVAEGGERYLTIGTFKQPIAPNLLVVNETIESVISYMVIDGIRLKEFIEGEEEEEEPQPETTLIPNIFTPNGDGTNDTWKLTLPGYDTHTVSVLNRWGELVYEAPAENFSWNGETANGTPCNEGVYFYRISGADISGFFELIR